MDEETIESLGKKATSTVLNVKNSIDGSMQTMVLGGLTKTQDLAGRVLAGLAANPNLGTPEGEDRVDCMVTLSLELATALLMKTEEPPKPSDPPDANNRLHLP